MSEQINKALIAASKAMPSLKKGDKNAHGGYAYVAIDDYYEIAAKVVVDSGLTWKIREVSCQIVEVQGNRGLTSAVITSYAVDLLHESGEMMMGFFNATITHPLQGAQTAGSSMSYLDKLFLRTTFHIVTGEKDADATDNAVFDLGPAPDGRGKGRAKGEGQQAGQGAEPDPFLDEPAPAPRAEAVRPALSPDAVGFLALASTFVSNAATEEELTKYWTDNEAAFHSLKSEDEEGYKALIFAFKARKKQLKGADA